VAQKDLTMAPHRTSHRTLTAIGVALALSLAACSDTGVDDLVDDEPYAIDADGDRDEAAVAIDAANDRDEAADPDAAGDDPGTADDDAGTDTDVEARAGEAVATDAVEARNINFEPADIEVEVGTTVTFTNLDIVRHTVTSGAPGEPDGLFDLDLSDQGDEVTFTFDEAGTYPYYCDLHRTMVGTVTVTG
jgi:plastocyanin